MVERPQYDPAFFSRIQDGSRVSARRIVPALVDLFHPKSVVDLGCGTGAWLSAFQEQGVSDVLGVDGDYVDRPSLLIPQERFLPRDLTQPLALDRRFDLALSLEVAEHLPEKAAATFIQNLTALSDAIVFSAAIPLQGGEHHVNEQWPEYWKVLFEARGFRVIDCLRGRFWNDPDVERWYRQNLLLYVKEDRLKTSPALSEAAQRNSDAPLSIVHPAVFLAPSLPALLRRVPRTLISGIHRRLFR